MKIIDDKGKLFGIINIIDLGVIMLLGLVIIGGWSRLRAKPKVEEETKAAEILFEVPGVRMATVENIEVGDPLYHYDKGELLGEISDVEYEPNTEVIQGNDGDLIEVEVPNEYDVSFKVKTEVKDNPDVVVAGGEQVRIGTQFRLKNKKVAIFSTVLGIEIE